MVDCKSGGGGNQWTPPVDQQLSTVQFHPLHLTANYYLHPKSGICAPSGPSLYHLMKHYIHIIHLNCLYFDRLCLMCATVSVKSSLADEEVLDCTTSIRLLVGHFLAGKFILNLTANYPPNVLCRHLISSLI